MFVRFGRLLLTCLISLSLLLATAGAAAEAGRSELRISVTADRRYAFVNRENVVFTVTVSGGRAPYYVEMKTEGAAIRNGCASLEGPGSCTFTVMPEEFGTLGITVGVIDTDGSSDVATARVLAPIRMSESPEVWEASIGKIEMTGDWRADALAVAKTQIGYCESQKSFKVCADGTRNGYTRYGDWYGAKYAEWCSIFVAFCLHYAGVSEDEFPTDMNCYRLKKLLAARGAYEDNEDEYVPRPGDLVFFNKEGKNRPEHVGFVRALDEEYIYTIEGNSNNAVMEHRYKFGSEAIVGYCCTETLMKSAGLLSDVTLEELSGRIPEDGADGYTTASRVNIRSAASVNGELLATIAAEGSPVRVLEAVQVGSGIWYRILWNDIEGYIRHDLIGIN